MIVHRFAGPFLVALPLIFAACGGESLTLPDEGEAAHIEVLEGDRQSGRVGSVLAESIVVQVTDTRDRPVAGAEVVFDFTEEGSGGDASPATTTTNADGRAAARLMLGTRVGAASGNAQVPVPAGVTPVATTFTATATSEGANGIALIRGNDQVAPVNSTLSLPLVVVVTDAFGNPIQGETIEWTVAGGGAVSEATTLTGADGQASVTRTLGSTAGQQTTLASATGLAGSPVTFTHTATAGSATGVVKISGDGQSGSPGAVLAQPLVVQVLDATGNPIPNRALTWVIGDGDGSVSPENTDTDAQGNASTSWTLGPAVGANTVNAVVSGLAPATFTATATAGEPSASNSQVSAAPTTVTVGAQSTITVTVRDGSDNPVSGASVVVESSGSGNTITPASASSGSNGVATFTFSSTVAEAKTITATAGGVAISDQATITVQKAASTTRITRDEPDRSTAGDEVLVEYTVTGPGGTPTGTVTITVSGGTETCSASVAAGECEIVLVTPGNPRVLTATYSGDERFGSSTDNENHRVDPAPAAGTTTTITSHSPDPSDAGAPITVSFTVTAASGTPAGTVTVTDGISGTCSATVAEGNCSYTPGGTGTRTITARYGGSSGFNSSSGTAEHTVNPPPANTAPTAGNDSYLLSGQNITTVEAAPFGLLVNDSDPDGPQPLIARKVSDPGQGSVTVNEDGSFTYTPPPLGASGSDSFTYAAFDGVDATTATVTLVFTAVRLE